MNSAAIALAVAVAMAIDTTNSVGGALVSSALITAAAYFVGVEASRDA